MVTVHDQPGLQFAALCLLLAEWLACTGITMGVATPDAAERWARASWLGVGLVPAALYGLTARLLGRQRDQRLAISLLWTAGAVVAVLAQTTDLLVAGVRPRPWGHFTHLAPAAAAVVALYLWTLLAVFALLALEVRRRAKPHCGERAY